MAKRTPVSPYWQNLYDKKAEWGPCYYDATHVLTSYATYDIPFGRDRKFGKSMNPVVNAVAGDWQANAILSLHTGFALTTSGPEASGTNSRGSRPNCLSPTSVFGTQNSPFGGLPVVRQFILRFWAGSDRHVWHLRRGHDSWSGLHTLDLSLAKFFNITER